MTQRSLTLLLSLAAILLLGADNPRAERGADFPLFTKDDVFFNGKDLSGWEPDNTYWSVENGEIVGKVEGNHPYSYLTTTKAVKDFRLTLKIKLTPNDGNSGIQVRSVRIDKNEMKGPQCDVGKGWWGDLYEEHARGKLTTKNGEQWVNVNDWNTYEIVFVGNKLRTAINGHLCVDMDDAKFSKQGIIGFQIHAGGTMEVRFKDLKLEIDPKFELLTLQ
jgi:hypothetical protein